MRYVTGMHALNLGDRSSTPGDWRFSAMDRPRPVWLDADSPPFGMYDIGSCEAPALGKAPVAGHVRACLDLIEPGSYGSAQGMRDDFLDDPLTDVPVMEHVLMLRNRPDWADIDRFMGQNTWDHGWITRLIIPNRRPYDESESGSRESERDHAPLAGSSIIPIRNDDVRERLDAIRMPIVGKRDRTLKVGRRCRYIYILIVHPWRNPNGIPPDRRRPARPARSSADRRIP